MRVIVGAAAVALFGGLLGCEKPLFPEDVPRSQYERYNQLRGETRVYKRTNPYGYEEPNLRERLRPLERNE